MSPEYKVGDRVRIIKRREPEFAYRFTFVNDMAVLEGNIYEISYRSSSPYKGERQVPDDGYLYNLKGSGNLS